MFIFNRALLIKQEKTTRRVIFGIENDAPRCLLG